MGKWVYKKSLDHVCVKPSYQSSLENHVGDIWQCECGQMWRITKFGYDQRDNDTWLEWEIFNGAIPEQKRVYRDVYGPYAPGTK